MKLRRKPRQVPGLNTASLPDLIFTVLFFFMIVTHMRSIPVKVKYQEPAGTELTKLTKKSAVIYIYIGQPMSGKGGKPRIQLNDRYGDVSDVAAYVASERKRMQPEDQAAMTVCLKVDRQVDMGLVMDVKQALREAGVYRVQYAAEEQGHDKR